MEPTSLYYALYTTYYGQFMLKLRMGEDPNKLDETGRLPLEGAMLGDKSSCLVDILLVYGADVNKRDDLGYTPLMLAARANHLEAAVALIVAGADKSLTQRPHWSTACDMVGDKESELYKILLPTRVPYAPAISQERADLCRSHWKRIADALGKPLPLHLQ